MEKHLPGCSDKKVVLITGASSGIGKDCAGFLNQKGYQVYGTSRKPGLETFPYPMIQMDVTEEASVKVGIAQVLEKEGRLDVVVNNAGMGIAGSLEDTTIEEIKFQMETNLFGVLRVCHGVIPVMRAQQFGVIINISSLAGLMGVPFQGAYSASKFALEGLTEVLRMEVKPFGIRTILIEPGDFNTGFTANRIKTKNSQVNSVYSHFFTRAIEVMEADEKTGEKPHKIALLVDHIINHPSPKPRYMVGPILQRIAAHLRKVLPQRLFEWLIMKNYKL